MRRHRHETIAFLATHIAFTLVGTWAHGREPFRIQEATITDINQAFDRGFLTCEALVQLYINRIEAYDVQGPNLNSIPAQNADALATSWSLSASHSSLSTYSASDDYSFRPSDIGSHIHLVGTMK